LPIYDSVQTVGRCVAFDPETFIKSPRFQQPMAEQLSAAQRHKLKRFIEVLEKPRGRNTELVTVYVPAGYELTKVIQQLAQEQGTATNIKSTTTRKNVLSGLERMIQHLRLYDKTPPHGLAAFSGNVAEQEGQQDVGVWSIEPPMELKIRIYRCDKQFILEPLQEMLEVHELYGLIVMDRRDASLATLKGKLITTLVETRSSVPGKFKAGGQSAARFARIREGEALAFYKKVADYAKDQFLHLNLKGLLIGGPGPNKHEFVDGGFLTGDLAKKVIAVKDLSYTGDFGLQELLERCQDVLAAEEVAKEKVLVNDFLKRLATSPGSACYGKDETLRLLKMGTIDIVLLSESTDDKLIDEFEAIAVQFGTRVELISADTREGAQLQQIGGIAGMLRYEVQDA